MIGLAAPGRIADLLLLDASPLEAIENSRRIAVAGVMLRGRWISKSDLIARRDSLVTANAR
jgi:imidazolonepropionase-like amidohydrolase